MFTKNSNCNLRKIKSPASSSSSDKIQHVENATTKLAKPHCESTVISTPVAGSSTLVSPKLPSDTVPVKEQELQSQNQDKNLPPSFLELSFGASTWESSPYSYTLNAIPWKGGEVESKTTDKTDATSVEPSASTAPTSHKEYWIFSGCVKKTKLFRTTRHVTKKGWQNFNIEI